MTTLPVQHTITVTDCVTCEGPFACRDRGMPPHYNVTATCSAAGDPTADCVDFLTWAPCACTANGASIWDVDGVECSSSPTGEHRILAGQLCRPALACFVAAHHELADAAYQAGYYDRGPGTYDVDYEVYDIADLILHPRGAVGHAETIDS